MKKLFYLLMVSAMCASLSACGGDEGSSLNVSSESSAPDTVKSSDVSSEDTDSGTADGPTEAQLNTLTDAYNQVAILYNDVAATAQDNGWMADQETNDAIQTIGAVLEPVGLALTGDMSALDGADFDALPDALLEFLPDLEALSEKVSTPYENGGDVVTDEALVPLANTYNELITVYNAVYEVAEANGWLADEQTSTELDAVYDTLTYIGSGLTDDPSKLEDVDLDELVKQLQQFGPAMEEVTERVSVPYEG